MGKNKRKRTDSNAEGLPKSRSPPPEENGSAMEQALLEEDLLFFSSSEDEGIDDLLGEEEESSKKKALKNMSIRPSSYFDKESNAAAKKRMKAALETAQKALSTRITAWKDMEMPNQEQTHTQLATRFKKMYESSKEKLASCALKFPLYFRFLESHYNILFYGFGSKIKLLELFAGALRAFEENLKRKPSCVLTIKGYTAACDLKQVVEMIAVQYCGMKEADLPQQRSLEKITKQIVDTSTLVRNHRSCAVNKRPPLKIPDDALIWERDLYLVIHNIDGEKLRSTAAKNTLAALAMAPTVRIIASVDHVQAPTLWDHLQMSKFNFLVTKTDTMQPYIEETSEKSIQTNSKRSSATAASYILSSLTQNHKDVLEKLAKHQINVDQAGMTFQELSSACLQDMTISNRNQLKQLLVEFQDHKIIARRKAKSGDDKLYITWDTTVMNSVLLE